MSNVIDSIERAQLRKVPRFKAGDTVRVHFQVIEGQRRRVQVFEGIVIKRQGSGARETFTVRKQSFGVGVERTFPLHSPKIERIDIAARGDVRRAKLYYLRGRVGKRARVRERRSSRPEQVVERELLYGPGSEQPEGEGTTGAGTEEPVAAADETEATATAATDLADQPDASEESAPRDEEQRGAEESPDSDPQTVAQEPGPAAEEEPAGEEQV